MKILLPLLIAVCPLLALGQLPQSLITEAEKTNSFDDYEGSIYQRLRFSDASLIHEKHGTFDAKFRYNIYTDAIEFKKGDQLYTVLKNGATHVRIDGDYYYYCQFKNQRGLKQKGYYILVDLNENYKIYKKWSLVFNEPSKKNDAFDAITPGKIQKVVSYFIEERGVIVKLPMNKKEILTTFNDKRNELETYMKSQKIKLRKEEDLIRLVSKYNTLKIEENGLPIRRYLLSNN